MWRELLGSVDLLVPLDVLNLVTGNNVDGLVRGDIGVGTRPWGDDAKGVGGGNEYFKR